MNQLSHRTSATTRRSRPAWTPSTQTPVCLWFCEQNGALDFAGDGCLFGSEMKLSLVA
jgi:hypothetical protein